MARKAKPNKQLHVESIRHKDTRTNIPTEELRDFVQEDEAAPSTMLYPRDPSLDPQLVWKGKDKQDREDLAVPVVPIYIQEKIHPQAIIDDLPRATKANAAQQLDLFADFNGMGDDFAERVEFYEHQQHWTNRMILGDSLMAMTSLAEKEGLKGKVQTIYIDPPYGIKFGSNWQVSTRKRDVKDSVADATRQPEQVKAFRDTWELGIHSYLAYLRDRLTVARDLLTESGSVFVQIGDENVHLVRSLLDEAFGAENFVSLITVLKTSSATAGMLPNVSDYIVWYAKSKPAAKYHPLFNSKSFGDPAAAEYKFWIDREGNIESLNRGDRVDERISSGDRLFRYDNLLSQTGGASTIFPVDIDSRTFSPSSGGWKTNRAGMDRLISANRIAARRNSIAYVRYLDDFPVVGMTNYWSDLRWGFDAGDKSYVVETNPGVVERCILMTTDPGDIVLDPTCGSGTTAFVAEQWGRRWITIDTSRVALALARTRLMSARYPFYELADSADGAKLEAELTGQIPPSRSFDEDIRQGFVYKRVPHITLRSIANNPDIKEGMTREEIDQAIARHSDFETLYDQPYEDNSKVRVSGPFTVESLSPHRILSVADEDTDGIVSDQEQGQRGDFAEMILENLRKAGVHNGIKGENIKFDRLDVHPGTWINATGSYTDSAGDSRSVAVSIGPEHGTVGPDQVKEAAKEAVRGLSHDVLVICGFAFDAHVNEEARRYGTITVLPTKMNPDLALGGDLLKKTGSGNLFMVFGEPDVSLNETDEGLVVEIHGVDVYDPSTGEVRSNKTDEIACWFVDTDYNEESFFVRHAYFTGAQTPYDKLKRVLRAEIDEDAWASLYRTESRPFAKPTSGKIAVKVINHFGDEVMKVYSV